MEAGQCEQGTIGIVFILNVLDWPGQVSRSDHEEKEGDVLRQVNGVFL